MTELTLFHDLNLAGIKLIRRSARLLGLVALTAAPLTATASFTVYRGGLAVEAQWRKDAGMTQLDTFESYAIGAQIAALPALGLQFDRLQGGGFPVIYLHGEDDTHPYGQKHLGNFPNGINDINRFDDIIGRVTAGSVITAIGFWNGDGQDDTYVLTVFDIVGKSLGTIGARKGTFAGFISDNPVDHVSWEGHTGDGWDHLDALQTNVHAALVPEPQLLGLTALAILLCGRRRLICSLPTSEA